MNYSPYFIPMSSYAPMAGTTSRVGLLSRLFGGGTSLGGIISGTGRVLGVVNQTIPLIKQATPVYNNMKTMFKVMNEFKKTTNNTTNSNTPSNSSNEQISNHINEENNNAYSPNDNGPTFFI